MNSLRIIFKLDYCFEIQWEIRIAENFEFLTIFSLIIIQKCYSVGLMEATGLLVDE